MFNQHYVNYGQIDALSLKTNWKKKKNHNLILLMITKGLNYFQTCSTHKVAVTKKVKLMCTV